MEGVLDNTTGLRSIQATKEETVDTEGLKIAKELKDVTEQLNELESIFNFVVEDELIESYIYEQNALKAKQNYLIRLAKEKNIRLTNIF